jgi:hypothetical protein
VREVGQDASDVLRYIRVMHLGVTEEMPSHESAEQLP